MTSPIERRTHRAVLEDSLPLEGARVADIGCGDGALVRMMTRRGARVTGLDPSPGQIGRARAAEAAGEENYIEAGGEDLPLPDGALDIAVFFNALHHVPLDLQDRALSEAARAVKPGGRVCIVEPIAEGDYFELTRDIEDETHVRAKAYEALKAAVADGRFAEERELIYRAPVRYESFEAFRDHLIAVDERRRPTVEARESQLRAGFEQTAARREGAFVFETPFRLNLLRRA